MADDGVSTDLGAKLHRSQTSRQIRGSVRDAIVQTVEGIVGLVDRERAERWSDKIFEKWNEHYRDVDGTYDFRLAKGFKMPAGMKYNGRLPSDGDLYQGPEVGKEIDDKSLLFGPIFLRSKKGEVEVLDSRDNRYFDIMAPYVGTQVAIAATVGTKGLTSVRGAFSVANLTSLKGAASVTATTSYLAFGSADMWGGLNQVRQTLNNTLFLKPEAIERFARLIDKPEKLTLEQMRDDLNLILEQYAKKSGRNTAQYYIPALTSTAGVMTLLDQMSKGQVSGYPRAHAFADIPNGAKKEDIAIGNFDEIQKNPYFRRSFFALAQKVIEGKQMTPSEQLALRFGMNIVMKQKDLSIIPENGISDHTSQANTIVELRKYLKSVILSDRMLDVVNAKESELKSKPNATAESVKTELEMYMTKWGQLEKNVGVSQHDMTQYLGMMFKGANDAVVLKEKLEMQMLQAQGMAMAMH